MKVRHLKRRCTKPRVLWIEGPTIFVSKEEVDAITAWLKSFVRF